VAKEKLFSEPPDADKTGPKGRFVEVATKVFGLSKAEIDQREKQWRRRRFARSSPTELESSIPTTKK
jgi:hypothetical protein